MCGMRISFPKVLKSERPDVNEKRSDLLKLQGTTVIHNFLYYYYYYYYYYFNSLIIRLVPVFLVSHGEESPHCLNEVKGRILDDKR